AILAGQNVRHDGRKKIIPQILWIKADHPKNDAALGFVRGYEVGNTPVIMLVISFHPATFESEWHFVMFGCHSELVDHTGSFNRKPLADHGDVIGYAFVQSVVTFMRRLNTRNEAVVILVIKDY